MRDSGATSALTNYDPQIVADLGRLRAACQACQEADEAQAQQVLSWVERAQNWCYGKAVDTYHQEGQNYVQAMWDGFDALVKAYESGVQPYAEVARNLHQVNVQTWSAVSSALDPIITDVASRQQQTQWTGAGAEEYMKQLPVQQAALQEFQQYVAVGGAGVETPALLQQDVFVMTAGLVRYATSSVRSMAGTEVGKSDFFQRCRAAGEYLASQLQTFDAKIVQGTGTWRPILDQHISRMTSDAVKNPSVLKKGTWPEATTTGSGNPATSSPKYTTPTGVGA